MFTHAAMLVFAPDAPDDIRTQYARHLGALVGVVPGLRSVTVHGDLGLRDINASVLFLAAFDSEADWRAYSAHPGHRSLGAIIAPYITAKSFLQSDGPLIAAVHP